jgi:hypothetical protein
MAPCKITWRLSTALLKCSAVAMHDHNYPKGNGGKKRHSPTVRFSHTRREETVRHSSKIAAGRRERLWYSRSLCVVLRWLGRVRVRCTSAPIHAQAPGIQDCCGSIAAATGRRRGDRRPLAWRVPYTKRPYRAYGVWRRTRARNPPGLQSNPHGILFPTAQRPVPSPARTPTAAPAHRRALVAFGVRD